MTQCVFDVSLIGICPVENVVGCRELVGRFVCVRNQECEGRHLFRLLERDHRFGFVWVCDDENAKAECRRPTNPLDKMFYFVKKYLG